MTRTAVEIKRLSREDIEQRLREYERTHALGTGESITSAEFYDRFRQGELDSLFGMRWAGYVRALERAKP